MGRKAPWVGGWVVLHDSNTGSDYRIRNPHDFRGVKEPVRSQLSILSCLFVSPCRSVKAFRAQWINEFQKDLLEISTVGKKCQTPSVLKFFEAAPSG